MEHPDALILSEPFLMARLLFVLLDAFDTNEGDQVTLK